MIIDKYKRFQSGTILADMYPLKEGICACGCGVALTGRKKKWASQQCARSAFIEFSIIQGNTGVIRSNLLAMQNGYCQMCGVQSDKWHADHILPVFAGGGGCTIDNFQTLCEDCHKVKTREDYVKYKQFETLAE